MPCCDEFRHGLRAVRAGVEQDVATGFETRIVGTVAHRGEARLSVVFVSLGQGQGRKRAWALPGLWDCPGALADDEQVFAPGCIERDADVGRNMTRANFDVHIVRVSISVDVDRSAEDALGCTGLAGDIGAA